MNNRQIQLKNGLQEHTKNNLNGVCVELLGAACCECVECVECVFTSEQSLSTTAGPTRHNIYSSQAANAAPLLLSKCRHSISLTSLGSHANAHTHSHTHTHTHTHSQVDSKGFSRVVCCCFKCTSLSLSFSCVSFLFLTGVMSVISG